MKFGKFKHGNFELGEKVLYYGVIYKIIGFDTNNYMLNVALESDIGKTKVKDSITVTHTRKRYLNKKIIWANSDSIINICKEVK